MLGRFVLVALPVLIVVFASCQANDSVPENEEAPRLAGETDAATATLSDLTALGDLRDIFNQDLGFTRIVLLVAPT